MPSVSRGGDAQHRQWGLRRQWPKVHQFESPSPRRCTHVQVKHVGPLRLERSVVGHSATARRRAVRSALGPVVTSRWGARASTALACTQPWASARRSYLVPRSATCGGAAGFTFPATEKLGATAGTQIHRVTSASHGHGVVQEHSTRGDDGASTQSLHKSPRRDGRSHARSSHGNGGAQEHERLKSSCPSGYNSSAARRPAHRQEKQGDASRCHQSITGR
jgi:hypothetical protein